MATINAAQATLKTVASPNAAYESMQATWKKCRALCSGEAAVKDLDGLVDTVLFQNLLIPFSATMDQDQYNFYKAEAELPGVTAQFARMLLGGLLRKNPLVTLPEGTHTDIQEWIVNNFSKDDKPLLGFLNEILWEEIQTSRAWVFVTHPTVTKDQAYAMSNEELARIKPFPVLWPADSVINWSEGEDRYGKTCLKRVIVTSLKEDFSKNEFHPEFIEVIHVHELDEQGYYQIRIYEKVVPESNVPVSAGRVGSSTDKKTFYNLVDTVTNLLVANQRMDYIPAWPLNGGVDIAMPMLTPIVDKEVSLYNKLSRRNHLMYGAATYTPYICSDMTDENFEEIVDSGLGTWLRLGQGDKLGILDTPTAALADMDRAIASAVEDLAKLGVRMMTPENAQSGVALDIRNASQTAQLGLLNTRASLTMKHVIACMINWRFALSIDADDISFSLTADFDPTPIGADWLRLATEWYQSGLIPRSVWLLLLKQNDMIDSSYDDKTAQAEINSDPVINQPPADDNLADKIGG